MLQFSSVLILNLNLIIRIRPTLNIKTLFYMSVEGWELSTLLFQLNTSKSVKDINLKPHDY